MLCVLHDVITGVTPADGTQQFTMPATRRRLQNCPGNGGTTFTESQMPTNNTIISDQSVTELLPVVVTASPPSGAGRACPLSSKPPQRRADHEAQGDAGGDRDNVAPARAPDCHIVGKTTTAQPDQDRPQQPDHDESKHQGDDKARHVDSFPPGELGRARIIKLKSRCTINSNQVEDIPDDVKGQSGFMQRA
jgi:hypothetical protein